MALGSGASLFACVYELVKHIIGGAEGEILAIVHQRLVRYDAEGAYSDALLQCDAAIQMLDIHDHQNLYDEQKPARSLQTDREIYAEDYRKQRMTLHPPKGKAKAKAKGRGKGKPLSIAMPLPSTIPPRRREEIYSANLQYLERRRERAVVRPLPSVRKDFRAVAAGLRGERASGGRAQAVEAIVGNQRVGHRELLGREPLRRS